MVGSVMFTAAQEKLLGGGEGPFGVFVLVRAFGAV